MIVELQSAKHHSTLTVMTADAERVRRLTLAGWTVIPVTWAQLKSRSRSQALARDLRRLLGRAAPPG